ncbi:hypothetical protein BC828DRAFT_252781 [Blastocladiella britannica]|nr:hypothetical protein BC828DRAFT_252781 [Blastocladiella britannica]
MLQFVPIIATSGPIMATYPVVVVVLVTAIKDAFEDSRRRRADTAVNEAKTQVLFNNPWGTGSSALRQSRWWRKSSSPFSSPNPSVAVTGSPLMIRDGSSGIPMTSHVPLMTASQPRPSSGLSMIPADWRSATWASVQVGDVVLVRKGEPFPADLLLIASSSSSSSMTSTDVTPPICHVDTKSLDGETNLKVRVGFAELADLVSDAEVVASVTSKPGNGAFAVTGEPPSEALYGYRGTLHFPPPPSSPDSSPATASTTKDVTVGLENLLLRGCVLRNTEWVVGLVLYTGHESKIQLNAGKTPTKRSRLDGEMGPKIAFNMIVLFITCALGSALYATIGHCSNIYGYLDPALWSATEVVDAGTVTAIFFSLLANLTTMVPIGVYVTVEFIKSFAVYYIASDPDMVWQGESCVPRSWNVVDDLGQVEYCFTDKTGTLTQNIMRFRQCCIGPHVYSGSSHLGSETAAAVAATAVIDPNASVPAFTDDTLAQHIAAPLSAEHGRSLHHFWTLLAVCHTVVVEPRKRGATLGGTDDRSNGQHHHLPQSLKYRAESPDEAALVAAARDVGYVFQERAGGSSGGSGVVRIRTPAGADTTLDNGDGLQNVQVLHTIPFDSTRKRMSVVVRIPTTGAVVVYTKGADLVVLDRCVASPYRAAVDTALDRFACDGLRTLALAYRELTVDEVNAMHASLAAATADISARDQTLADLADVLETNLTLLGATAIEDRLQDGVPTTIEALHQAGIHVWMLTGDKAETAISIGKACNLIRPHMDVLSIRHAPSSTPLQVPVPAIDQLTHVVTVLGTMPEDRQACVVVDGESLADIMLPEHRPMLLRLCRLADHVICCRASPLQKAQVVAVVRHEIGAMTLAIGDGANDVSMIQAAHVGVGISGEEGRQATNAADFAFGQFRFLARLLFVHGRWSALRVGNGLLYYLYRHAAMIYIDTFFNITNGFSASTYYDIPFMNVFVAIFTQIPISSLGTFDRDLTARTVIKYPHLYAVARTRLHQSKYPWMILEYFVHAFLCYAIPTAAYYDTVVHPSGYESALSDTGMTIGMAAYLALDLMLLLHVQSVHLFTMLSILWSSIGIFFFFPLYSLIGGTAVSGYAPLVMQEPAFWLSHVLVLVCVLLPRAAANAWSAMVKPDEIDIFREIEILGLPEPDGGITVFPFGGAAPLDKLELEYDKKKGDPVV